MGGGAKLSVTDLRRASRHPVDCAVPAEHRRLGTNIPMHISNISSNGFMVDNADALERGDRVLVRLPVIGRIEGHCIWTLDTRAGFQFERIIPADEFTTLVRRLQPNPALRPKS